MPVQDNEKSALSADEILKSAEKIQQNIQEDKTFSDSLSQFLDDSQEHINRPIIIGTTPNSLIIAGADESRPLTINPETILKCMGNPNEVYHGHELSKEILEQLPNELRNPALILKGSHDGSLVAVTELKDKQNREIIVAVELESKQQRHLVNRITSAYGRNNFKDYLNREVNIKNNLIACNKEKADEIFQSLGLQSPPEETFISYDNSITYTMSNVKSPTEKISEKNEQLQQVQYKSKNLLPILNTVCKQHEERIDSLNSKKSTREDKIIKNTLKIDKLTAKSERLGETNKMLKSLSVGALSKPISMLISKNQDKIDKIKNISIPKSEKKIENHKNKIKILDHKIAVSQAKADKIIGLNGAIKSFAVLNPDERRKQFAQNMDIMHDASKRTLQFKINKCTRQLETLYKQYNNVNSTAKKFNLNEKIEDLQSRKEDLSIRMDKLNSIDKSFTEHNPQHIDKLMIYTENELDNTLSNQNIQISQLPEKAVIDGADYLRTTEMSIEGNYNNIDGVINNLPPEKEESIDAKSENIISQLNSQTEELKQNMSEQNKTEKQEKSSEEQLNKENNLLFSMINNEKAEIQKDGSFRINVDYYHKLPKENKHIETFNTEQAMSIIENLAAMNIEFSAISTSDKNHVTITTDKSDLKILKEFSEISAKAIDDRLNKESIKDDQIIYSQQQSKDKEELNRPLIKINTEYYTSLPKSERHTVKISKEPKQTAKKIMDILNNKNIPYSAVEYNDSSVAITVSKSNEQAFKEAQQSVKSEHIQETINPNYYKELPKEDRYTQRMPENDVRYAVNELKKEGVQHSAVIDGKNSAVTVHKKDKGAVFFSRKQLQKQVEKLKNSEKEKSNEQKNHDKKNLEI